MLCKKLVLVTLGLIFSFGWTWSYQATTSVPVYDVVPVGYEYSSASKLHNVNLAALDHYGYEIGVPLLVRNYGPLTSLYSALAPKRSFVGTVDPGFYKDSYGKIKFRGETAVGAVAI